MFDKLKFAESGRKKIRDRKPRFGFVVGPHCRRALGRRACLEGDLLEARERRRRGAREGAPLRTLGENSCLRSFCVAARTPAVLLA